MPSCPILISLCLSFSSDLGLHQRSFFVQLMVVNKESHNAASKLLGNTQPQWLCITHTQAQEPVMNKRQKKELKGKLEQMVSSRRARTDAIMNTQQCGGGTRSSQSML